METEIITKAFEALDEAAAAVGQTAAEYWPQWVGLAVARAWLWAVVPGLLSLVFGGVALAFLRKARRDDKAGRLFGGDDARVGAWVCFGLAGLAAIGFVVSVVCAALASAYPDIYAAEVLLRIATGGCR